MTPETVMNIGRQAVEVTILVSSPVLLVALVVGLLISIFQAATSLNETTLSFVPKIIAMFLTLIFAGPWMLQMMTDYIQRLYSSIPSLIG
ncbi:MULTISPECIES: flagellar biosynthesis protein FliQ [Azospira]|jgi:flagellar biosynthetic protein FliQ|uniref:Flagellar biosynthetic protein FliQ n=2 Tax=Azospira oryzae TaxID=146939 RepID=G8QG57_AZOOP|nr:MULTISPECIES: flagellar biosynthesis protein FliQ [Azospira]AEV26130.1 flagellar biosynthetic protein FliQ [Azospira oryzae PS]MDK9690394.1 flagellar biosynthesis protein FliQ [Azospira sp.]RZT75602.1 flagellar biosynthetic protein FliQ [Azospira oryzae]